MLTRTKLAAVEIAVECFDSLARAVRDSPDESGSASEWNILAAAIEALPCDSDEYCRCVNHLRNSLGYVLAREPGAAIYELRLLGSHLHRFLASA
jgi:hypothetical protein